MPLLKRLGIFLVWSVGATLCSTVAFGWELSPGGEGFFVVFITLLGFGFMVGFTWGLLPGVFALWLGPRIRSDVRRFLLILGVTVFIVGPAFTWPMTREWEEPNLLNDARVVFGYSLLVPLSWWVSRLLGKAPLTNWSRFQPDE